MQHLRWPLGLLLGQLQGGTLQVKATPSANRAVAHHDTRTIGAGFVFYVVCGVDDHAGVSLTQIS
jgi:hypothetical protein